VIRKSERTFRVEFVSFGHARYAVPMAPARTSGRQLLAPEGTAPHKEKSAMVKYEQRQRKAMFIAYEMGLSVKDIAHALDISRQETLRILQEDRWMYEGLTRVREYDRQLFAKGQRLRQTGAASKSGSLRMRQQRRMRQKGRGRRTAR